MEDFSISFDSQYITVKKIFKLFQSEKLDYDTEYEVLGTVDSVRFANKNTLAFVDLRTKDSIRSLQCTRERTDEDTKLDDLWSKCSRGSCFSFKGKIVKLDTAQLFEMKVSSYKCFGDVRDKDTYPLGGKGKINVESLRKIPHLKCQTKLMSAIDIITSTALRTFHKSMHKMKIDEIQPVLLTGNECEASTHPFVVTTLFSDKQTGDSTIKLNNIPTTSTGSFFNSNEIDTGEDFFGKFVYLTVSAQLHGEAIAVTTKSSKYWMTKAFRAEPSAGLMHAAEFLMPEWEIISDKLEDNMKVAEQCIKSICYTVLKKHGYELEFLEQYRLSTIEADYKEQLQRAKGKDQKEKIKLAYDKKKSQLPLIDRLVLYVKEPFVISTHEECVTRMLDDSSRGLVKFDKLPAYDDDISREHEHYITDVIYKGKPVFVRFFPKKVKAFYMPIVSSETGDRVDGFDLLMPYIGEVVGGSMRVSDEKDLIDRMDELKMNKESLQWYIDLRKYGSVPHGGAGLGFSRLIMALTGMSSIRDTDQFPRAYGLELRC
jgi:asparaginyl-tRNA synthetase